MSKSGAIRSRHSTITGAELFARCQAVGVGKREFARLTGIREERASDMFNGRLDGDIPLWVDLVLLWLESQARRAQQPIDPAELPRLVGRRIMEARTAAGMTQRDLAERSGVPQPSLPAIERGEVNITVETLGRLAQALGVSPADLLCP